MQIDLHIKQQQILGARRIPRIVVEGTSGVVFLNLTFDEEWRDCAVTVLLTNSRTGDRPVALLWRGEPLEIPAELLVSGVLTLSCVGLRTDENGTVWKRLTTARMTEGIRIYAAGEQSGYEAGSTVPGLWEQTLAAVGPLQELQAADKTSLVAAVNEALAREPGNGGGVGIHSIEQTVTSEEDGGVNEITVTMTDGTKQVLTVRNGTAGKTPVKGVDYFTESEILEIAALAAEQSGGSELPNAMEVRF